MMVINGLPITWMVPNLVRPVPVPHGKGAMPKIMSMMCLFCPVMLLMILLYSRNLQDLILQVFITDAGAFIFMAL
jgi:hypothetical protein